MIGQWSPNRVQLIEALRSGSYQQSIDQLRQKGVMAGDYDLKVVPLYCIGGMMCEVYRQHHPLVSGWEEFGSSYYRFWCWSGDDWLERSIIRVPETVLRWYGITRMYMGDLQEMNDDHITPFVEFADIIENGSF